MNFLVSQGSSSTKNELLDFFDMNPNKPTASALNQQRAKLKPEALQAVFHEFKSSVNSIAPPTDYRFLAADGSTVTFLASPLSRLLSIMSQKDILPRGSTASI